MVASFRSHISDLGVFLKPHAGRQKNANTQHSHNWNSVKLTGVFFFLVAAKTILNAFFIAKGSSTEIITEDAARFRARLVNTECKRIA